MLKFVGSTNEPTNSDLTAHASTTTSTISSDSQTNPGQIDLGSATRTFTVETAMGSAAIGLSISAQIIAPGGALTKAGAGVLELTSNNTYAGGTNVNAGTLLVNNSTGSGTGSGTVMVNTGTLGGNGTISGLVTMSSSGTNNLAPGQAATAGSIAALHVGALTMASTSTLNIDIGAGGIPTGAGAGTV
jgi:autotransporter-associated beta strand protein